ncbi:MAG: metalloregulator ArsR/SmtB family transcription factor [candidate division Zixibacteria bacterium]|nr:metalloregulator ArsR/SmtB family transcription factor [candidate division Zixibacteria bacterium]MBU1470900.1 metalloregulator ArsR/SmtB family transcription factor [candidate division Zixibacteria bacterium]MBU2624278.1 metalloregulator ArsR/SmtB family transcription factor [candidate division Zixibacteria bacterium]
MSNNRNDDIERFARLFKALSNPNRLNIFSQLASCCDSEQHSCTEDEVSACVGELGADLQISPSTVSHHIKELHMAGLIRMERSGQSIRCWVDKDTLKDLRRFLCGSSREALMIPD